MADFVVMDGDQAVFLPIFGAAVVVVKPGVISGSGPMTRGGAPVCVEGDEGSVSVPGCVYITPQYIIPGTGTLKIDGLAGDQVASLTQTGGKPVILVGSNFQAVFEVQAPAMQPIPPAPPVPDPTTSYNGQGQFVTTNTKLRGT